ncbi:MAG: TetR/AcrR family transcriptional regulator [Pseudomonadota bacterium]
MARRSDHSREEIAALAIASAKKLISENGIEEASIRKVAGDIGYSPGTLYNVFEDFYEIIIAVAEGVLDEMIAAASTDLEGKQGREGLYELADFYVRFTQLNYHRWRLVTEYQLPKGKSLPKTYVEKMNAVLGFIERAIKHYFPESQAMERRKTAVTLWASLHGVCSVSSNSLARIPPRARRELARILVDRFVVGLEETPTPVSIAS